MPSAPRRPAPAASRSAPRSGSSCAGCRRCGPRATAAPARTRRGSPSGPASRFRRSQSPCDPSRQATGRRLRSRRTCQSRSRHSSVTPLETCDEADGRAMRLPVGRGLRRGSTSAVAKGAESRRTCPGVMPTPSLARAANAGAGCNAPRGAEEPGLYRSPGQRNSRLPRSSSAMPASPAAQPAIGANDSPATPVASHSAPLTTATTTAAP